MTGTNIRPGHVEELRVALLEMMEGLLWTRYHEEIQTKTSASAFSYLPNDYILNKAMCLGLTSGMKFARTPKTKCN